jgi:hypothetical protein
MKVMLKRRTRFENMDKIVYGKWMIFDKSFNVFADLCTHVWVNILPELLPNTWKLVCCNVQSQHVCHRESGDL